MILDTKFVPAALAITLDEYGIWLWMYNNSNTKYNLGNFPSAIKNSIAINFKYQTIEE